VFQKEADGTESFGRIDAYKRNCFVLEAKLVFRGAGPIENPARSRPAS